MTVGGASVAIDEPHARYSARLPGRPIAEVRSPRRDVLLEADGTFALSEDRWFDPLPFILAADTAPSELDARGIRYLLTTYEPPALDGGMRRAVAVFETAKMDRTADGDYRIAIITPGVEDGASDVRLVSAAVTMRRTPLGWLDGLKRFFGLFRGRDEDGMLKVYAEGTAFGESPE
jgi:hypothetical protein